MTKEEAEVADSLSPSSQPSNSEDTDVEKAKQPTRIRRLLSRQFAGMWAILLIPVLLGLVVIAFNNKLIPALQTFLEKMNELGVWGYVIMIALQAILSNVPLPGFSIMLLANGFAFGFPLGMIPLYIGTIIGGSIAFYLARYVYMKPYRSNLLNVVPELGFIDRAVLAGDFKVALLIRLAAYSYPLMNFLFATTSITYTRFLLITLIANFKYLINCYVGGYLRSLTLGLNSPVQIAVVCAMAAFGIGVAIFLFIHVRKVLARYAVDGAEEVEVTGSKEGEEPLDTIVTTADGKEDEKPHELTSNSASSSSPAIPSVSESDQSKLPSGVANKLEP